MLDPTVTERQFMVPLCIGLIVGICIGACVVAFILAVRETGRRW